ncbi:hypothetical protein ACLB2K_010907 [Fragaria x ananassa]
MYGNRTALTTVTNGFQYRSPVSDCIRGNTRYVCEELLSNWTCESSVVSRNGRGGCWRRREKRERWVRQKCMDV